VMMNTSGDGHRTHEAGFVYKRRDTMGDAGVISMKTVLCPTGGLDNILRFEKTFDGGGDAYVLVKVDEKDVDIVPIDDSGGAEPIRADDQGDVRTRVQVEEGGGAVPVQVDDRGGADHVRVQIAADGGDGTVHTDGGDVMAEAADGGGRVHVPIYGGSGAASDQAEERQDVNQNIADVGDVHDHTHIDEGGGAVLVTEREDVTEDDDNYNAPGHGDDGEGDVCVPGQDGAADDSVDRMEGILMANAAPNEDAAVAKYDVTEGDGSVKAHIDEGGGTVQVTEGSDVTDDDGGDEHVQVSGDDRDTAVEVSVEDGAVVTKMLVQGVPPANEGDGTVSAPVENEVDLTKVVEDQGDVHVPAHIDEGGGAIGMKPEVDKDGGDVSTPENKKEGKLGNMMTKPERFAHGGGGDIPTLEEREAGKLGIVMTKSEKFGHERGGGIAKCTRPLCCAFMLVGNAGKLGPRGRGQAHLTAAP
jgi:hypothetical protein